MMTDVLLKTVRLNPDKLKNPTPPKGFVIESWTPNSCSITAIPPMSSSDESAMSPPSVSMQYVQCVLALGPFRPFHPVHERVYMPAEHADLVGKVFTEPESTMLCSLAVTC